MDPTGSEFVPFLPGGKLTLGNYPGGGIIAEQSRPQAEREKIEETPVRDRLDYRRHRGACPFYRENWTVESDAHGGEDQLLYQIICLWDTPPVTDEEQQSCLHSPTRCWRANHPSHQFNRNGQCAASVKGSRANGHAPDDE